MTKKLVVCGDSWTFGSEIIDPDLVKRKAEPFRPAEYKQISVTDHSWENDEYRIPKIWSSVLGSKVGCEVINLSCPSVGNGWIYNTALNWMIENYISVNRAPDDFRLVIGWSTIARKEFLFNINNEIVEKTFHASDHDGLPNRELTEFYKWYLLVAQNEYSEIYDFVDLNFHLQMFCEKYGVEYYCFNALPEEYGLYETSKFYKDLKVINYMEGLKSVKGLWGRNFNKEVNMKWGLVSNRSFILKDMNLNSFANYISQLPLKDRLNGVHPTPQGHKIWAEFLYRWIIEKQDTYMKDINNALFGRKLL